MIELDIYMKQVVIENANKKENIDVEQLINELTYHKKVPKSNINQKVLDRLFAQSMIYVKRE